MHKYGIEIDEEFLQLMFPRQGQALDELRYDILFHGKPAVVTLWKNYIVDGYDAYKIAKESYIHPRYKSLNYYCRDKVMAWICEQQANREDLPKETRWYCIGKRYDLEKEVSPIEELPAVASQEEKDRNGRNYSDFGYEYGLSRNSIRMYHLYAQALDHIRDHIPELTRKFLDGEIYFSQKNMMEILKFDEVELQQLYEHVVVNKRDFLSFKKTCKELKKVPRKNKKTTVEQPTASIKIMPQYDPDAELSSLSLTIPSWISSIERVKKNLKKNEVSESACINAFVNLCELIRASEEMKNSLEG